MNKRNNGLSDFMIWHSRFFCDSRDFMDRKSIRSKLLEFLYFNSYKLLIIIYLCREYYKGLKMNRLFVILLAMFCTSMVYSQVTFTKDVAKIIYNKCTSCHRQGEIGPFSLMNYQDTKQRAASIKRVTISKFMPPWKPDPSFSRHLGENFLTDEEIKKISDWVDSGSPYGNATEEPPIPNFPTGSALGKPDLVLSFSKKHIHKGDNKDKYRYFVLPSGLLEDKVVKAVEVRPGNAKIVHHALIFQDTTGQAKLYDSRTPEYGFEGTSGFSTEQVIFFTQYPGYAPGQKALYFPDGIGQKLNKGADVVIQVHYAPISKEESDSTTINIFFADKTEKVNRFVQDYILLPFNLVTGAFSFIIQPNTVPTFEGRLTLTEDRSIMGIFPHMHLLGKKWEVWLERPDGSKENLVRINDWDFNWQSNYYFKRYVPAPKGSVIVAKATYDNTTKNPYNPFSPPRRVSWGQNTTDEMYYLPILSVPYKAGDENIVFQDVSTSVEEFNEVQTSILGITPNPSSSEYSYLSFNLHQGQDVNISVFDTKGQLIRTIKKQEYYSQGQHSVPIHTETLPLGSYVVRLNANGVSYTSNLIVVR